MPAASAGTLKVGLWKQAETRNQEVISYLDSENFDYGLINIFAIQGTFLH